VKVVIVSGIWPPDVGGPASHAPEVADFLGARGHGVEAVVTAGARPAPRAFPVHWTSRRLPPGARHAASAALIARRARHADVVYSTGMFARTALAARAVRRPFVLKLTGDPAFERARWRGSVAGDVEAFQRGGGGAQAEALRRLRNRVVRSAAFVFCPSDYLSRLAVEWGADPARVEVLPNPAPAVNGLAGRDELRAAHGVGPRTLVFAGRLTAQKALGTLLAATAEVPDATLLIVGDGPEREAVAAAVGQLGLDSRVRLLGPQPRERTLELARAADAAVLSSAWENFPHSVVEALAVGTPVVATNVGGVAEVVQDGVNGLLVPPQDVGALAAALRRVLDDVPLRERLAASAAASVAPYAPELIYGRLEDVLVEVAR
jgi:glycosyltransferase involved in cell wall biosynthesis